MAFTQQHLARAEQHVRDGERRVAQLRRLIDRMAHSSPLLFAGERLLTEFKIALRGLRAHRDLVRSSIAAGRTRPWVIVNLDSMRRQLPARTAGAGRSDNGSSDRGECLIRPQERLTGKP